MKMIIVPQPGYSTDVGKLVEVARLLVDMGYKVSRGKFKRGTRKTVISCLVVEEMPNEADNLFVDSNDNDLEDVIHE